MRDLTTVGKITFSLFCHDRIIFYLSYLRIFISSSSVKHFVIEGPGSHCFDLT